MSIFLMEFTYFWAKCQYFQLNFYTLEQNVDVSSGFSLLLSKLSLFPMEFHYLSAKCQYFHRNFTTFEPHVNISLGFSLFLNLSPPITRGPYHGGGAFWPWALAHICWSLSVGLLTLNSSFARRQVLIFNLKYCLNGLLQMHVVCSRAC